MKRQDLASLPKPLPLPRALGAVPLEKLRHLLEIYSQERLAKALGVSRHTALAGAAGLPIRDDLRERIEAAVERWEPQNGGPS